MKNKKELLEKLQKDVYKLEKGIECKKSHNFRNCIVRGLIKSGIAFDYVLPFILAGVVFFYYGKETGNTPFYVDDNEVKARVENMDTSSGIHSSITSFDYDFEEESLKYSTGWILNEYGLYERTVTSYKINDMLDLNDTNKILNMTKEEIENIVAITNVEKIQKNELEPDDEMYKEDMIIITSCDYDEDNKSIRKESIGKNIGLSILYIILVLLSGIGSNEIKKVFGCTYVRDKLTTLKPKYKTIDQEELERLKKLLEMKKENLKLLDEKQEGIKMVEPRPSVHKLERR